MNRHNQEGFTLVELLIVIAIIGILAVVLIPSLINARSRAVDVAAQSYLKDAAIMQEVVHNDTDTYTDAKSDLTNLGLKSQPSGVTFDVIDADTEGYCMTSTRTNGSGKVFFVTVSGGLSNSLNSPVCTAAG